MGEYLLGTWDYRPPIQGGLSASSHRTALAGVLTDSFRTAIGGMRSSLLTDEGERRRAKRGGLELTNRPINVRRLLDLGLL